MSASFSVSVIAVETVLVSTENVTGLDKAKRYVEECLRGVGIHVNATDWRRNSDGCWYLLRRDSKADVVPQRPFVPHQRRGPGGETR